MVTWRLRVDPVACDGYGYCAELLPEHVTLDEWGYPRLDGTPVPPRLVDLARRAVADCPRRALALVEERGPTTARPPARLRLASSGARPSPAPAPSPRRVRIATSRSD